ncbi:HPP family protein [Durotheca rogersii]|uniref:HPP family protein n=1 Tax=Durotheca rogersii TaxID=419775 RepID=UPI00221F1992|nr:HPP family protein [Durotheca rogersii]KAI5857333.1 HPP family protein [Durotheca rogersii]
MPFNPSKWHFEIDGYLNPWVPSAPWKHLSPLVSRFMGHRSEHQRPLGNLFMIFWAFIGVFCSLTIIEVVGRAIPSFEERGAPIIIGSFGAAAVLEFYVIESPLSQPRNAVLGQFFASLVGVAISKLFALGPQSRELTWLAGSLSCACAVAVMALTGTVHPPAGATALLAVVDSGVAGLGWFLLPIMLLGCALMQAVALLLNNVQRRFPVYWWTPAEVGQRLCLCRRKRAAHHQHGEGGQSGDDGSGGGSGNDSGNGDGGGNGAKLEITSTRHLEEGRTIVEESRLIVRRGGVSIPDDLYLSPEERIFLEELSGRI